MTRVGSALRKRRLVSASIAATASLVALVLLPTDVAIAAEDDFTIVVIPDTQGYTNTGGIDAIFDQQTQWIVDQADDLDTRFAIHVGDLVESWPNVNQWSRASRSMAILDAAGVPSSVLPGNHDLSITTGESSTYDTYFPPSRYAAATWNSTSVRYGGYLGQNQFGPDGIDRQNKDNYALLDAGGLELLILNLEFESPAYSLAWAQRVIDAYPDRRVILATHGFITTTGNRSNTVIRTDTVPKSANDVWNELVYRNCNIFMVVNGHWHDGELSEARRTDPNACGRPVHQILSDYQDRANGGNGWLRYYTFHPASDTIDAFTYSPYLQQMENDADSRFTLSYDMHSPPGGDPVVLLAGGSPWSWRYESGAWPAGWTGESFDDSAWARGAAPLGRGSGTIATVIDKPAPTSNRPLSMLFRHRVELAQAHELVDVRLITRADDGVVLHVNGVEVGRSNMPTGAVTSGTYATAAPRTSAATASPTEFLVPAGLLHDGTNTIAASTHLNYRATTDASFELVMAATRVDDTEPTAPATPSLTAESTHDEVTLSWAPGDATPVQSWMVVRDGQPLTTLPGGTTTMVDAEVSAATAYSYGVRAVGTTGLESEEATVAVTTDPAPSDPVPVVLVDTGSQWRWQYRSGSWPTGWTTPAFNDLGWNTGSALFGFGAPGIATVVDVPPPTSGRPLSAQFRHTFTVADADVLTGVTLTTRADDGVVVYVNGVEVARRNMPAGVLSAGSYATAAPRTTAAPQVVVTIPASALHDGANTVAASVHLNYRATRDMTFDARINAMAPPG